ncbi:MAG TPA: GNAT family N-acetyltransferase [Streptosporangiaceae bacterium]|jgi:hypothetical protein
MIPAITSSVSEAVKFGYASLVEPDDLYDAPGWHAIDEAIGIARPFTVLALPEPGAAQADAAAWGMLVEPDTFWPFLRADSVLSMFARQRGLAGPAAQAGPLAGLMPSAYLGALRAGTTRFLLRPGMTGEQARAALRSLLAGAEEMAREEGLRSVGCLYLPAASTLEREVLAAAGYAEFGPALHVAILPVSTFEDYLASMNQHRRSNVRRHRRLVARAGVSISREPLTESLSEQMLPLEAQLYQKYEHVQHPTEMARIVHRGVIAAFGDRALVITARSADGVLRGYSAFIHVGDTLYSRDCGFDYTWQGRLPLYLVTNYHSAVELAEDLGARRIHYSYGSDETKAGYGCELHPRISYVKSFDPALAARLAELAERARVQPAQDHARPAP